MSGRAALRKRAANALPFPLDPGTLILKHLIEIVAGLRDGKAELRGRGHLVVIVDRMMDFPLDLPHNADLLVSVQREHVLRFVAAQEDQGPSRVG